MGPGLEFCMPLLGYLYHFPFLNYSSLLAYIKRINGVRTEYYQLNQADTHNIIAHAEFDAKACS
jgi:hypothetical protein